MRFLPEHAFPVGIGGGGKGDADITGYSCAFNGNDLDCLLPGNGNEEGLK